MEHQTTYNQIAGQKSNRIEALSDGVFSIAMTLLVLDLKVPVNALIHSEGDLWRALSGLGPSFLAYGLGFMTLGIFWMGQTTQFTFIERSNRGFLWLHVFFLMIISLLPFSTAFLSAHITYKTAIGVYWLTIFLAGFALYACFAYAVRHNLTSLNPTDEHIRKAIFGRITAAQGLYAFGALLCFINPYLSIGFILVVQLNYALGLTGNR